MAEKQGPWQLGGMPLAELGKRTWKEVNDDAGFDAAAALGYYFMLALFPLLIFLISLLTTVGSVNLIDSMMSMLANVMPQEAYKLIGGEITRILKTPGGGLLTFGALGTLWAASSGVSSVLDGLNRAYDVDETRSFFKRRLLSIGLTIALALLVILGSLMLVMSDMISEWIVQFTHQEWLGALGVILNSAFGLGFMFLGLELLYYYGPNVKGQKWSWISPGSLVSVLMFVIASIGFSLYVRYGGDYSATYGSLGAIIVLMLWLNLLGLAIIIGGEVNSEIAKAALEHGNKSAPKVAAEKDTLAVSPFEEKVKDEVALAAEKVQRPVPFKPAKKLLPQFSSASIGEEAIADAWMYESGPAFDENLQYKNAIERMRSKINRDSPQVRRAKAMRRLAEIEAHKKPPIELAPKARGLARFIGTLGYWIGVGVLSWKALSKSSSTASS